MALEIENFSDLQQMIENDTLDDYIMQLLNTYENLGPLPGLLLPMLEAFLPFLPLFVFVLANSMAYGLLEGFLFSWAGAVVGAILVFTLIRRLGQTRLFQFIRRNKQVKKVMSWLERHGFGLLFLLLCFPFSPSAVINVVVALSRVSYQQFFLAVILGKAVMIFTISYVGHSITSFATQPMKTIVVGIGTALFWMLGKYIEKRLHKAEKIEQEKQ
ncbi:putative membrane protein YdjX (TVP38/TMEM64 family) [Melghiribacillus thermohalophilus]|uniref:TVP38/TMEM64 family membrane protein n=1 Tax=Melghiribacillus thermohalophilus TaxID=1324956 RepID=A0A4R3MR89_9BACI|nr:TVP38/TMEM64 family protein [Melghiribacillus thermohalophilus]TCT16698.1 putative membrane protein YdjX (TVP38/TMEM64 family) [Melghiribacillus thermohalophilus]